LRDGVELATYDGTRTKEAISEWARKVKSGELDQETEGGNEEL
jgi:hypothetical protein